MKEIHYVPLGYDCNVAQYCKKNKLRTEAYPFDWLISPINLITKAIEKDFEGFATDIYPIQKQVQTYIDTKEKIELIHGFCKSSHMYFLHDIRANEPIENELKLVEEKYNRRAKRLLQLMEERKIIYFLTDKKTIFNVFHEDLVKIVREKLNIETKVCNRENDERVLKDEIYEFKMMLKRKYPGLKFKIIQVDKI